MSLRSILGGSNRVKKSSRPRSSASRPPSSSPWTDSLPRSKPGAGLGSKKKTKKAAGAGAGAGADDADLFGDRLDDCGLVRALATDLTLRDVVQAMRYARGRMFSSMPAGTGGMNSTRTAEVLGLRRGLPAVVTTSHLHALLASPTAVERETADLIRAGVVRRLVVPRRGGIGEVLVQTADLEALLLGRGGPAAGAAVGEDAREALLRFLREEPAAQRVPRARLTALQSDQLVRAGFLTAHLHHDVGAATSVFARPEDRATMVSLERVSQAASGSYGAVGGQGALHAAGGTGGGGGGAGSGGVGDMALTVPGLGAFLKLASAALAHLAALLAKSSYKEASETLLRERWDGGVARDEGPRAERGQPFAGVLPGRTRKWKEFYGLSFDWVLCEAVGGGLVEVFETGSVGRGVRLL